MPFPRRRPRIRVVAGAAAGVMIGSVTLAWLVSPSGTIERGGGTATLFTLFALAAVALATLVLVGVDRHVERLPSLRRRKPRRRMVPALGRQLATFVRAVAWSLSRAGAVVTRTWPVIQRTLVRALHGYGTALTECWSRCARRLARVLERRAVALDRLSWNSVLGRSGAETARKWAHTAAGAALGAPPARLRSPRNAHPRRTALLPDGAHPRNRPPRTGRRPARVSRERHAVMRGP